MKKLAALIIVLVLAISLMAIPVSAAGKGAVKVDLLTGVGPPAQPAVGSVILNTTGNGYLNVLVNVDALPDLIDWDVRVFFKDNSNPTITIFAEIFPDVLNTNAQGQGNAEVKSQIPTQLLNDIITVDVLIRPSFAPPTGSIFSIGNTVVPQK